MWVVEWSARGTIAGSLGLSESSGKTSHTVSNSFLSSFSTRVGVGMVDVFWVKRQRSMSLISSLVLARRALTSEFSAVTFAAAEGS